MIPAYPFFYRRTGIRPQHWMVRQSLSPRGDVQVSPLPPYRLGPLSQHFKQQQQSIVPIRQIFQALSGGLSFTGPTHLTNLIFKKTTANLTFTGPTNLTNATTKALVGAVLSFTGPTNLTNSISKSITAGLTFAGSISRTVAYHKILTAALSFTGSFQINRTFNKILTAVLSFTGLTAGPPRPYPMPVSTQIATIPPIYQVATNSEFPYSVDVSNYVSGADVVTAAWTVLQLVQTATIVTGAWRTPMTITNNVIQFSIFGSFLQLGQRYQLNLTFNANTNKVVTLVSFFDIVAPI